MTPAQLASVNAESSHQRAFFSWCNMAERHGFAAAWDELSYSSVAQINALHRIEPIPELRWLHAIPNGEKRDMITAANLKAAGVKKGILDVFLPLPMLAACQAPAIGRAVLHAGLYIELKRPGTTKAGARKGAIVDQRRGNLSPEQDAFVAYAIENLYAVYLAFTWEEAATGVQSYIEACRKNA